MSFGFALAKLETPRAPRLRVLQLATPPSHVKPAKMSSSQVLLGWRPPLMKWQPGASPPQAGVAAPAPAERGRLAYCATTSPAAVPLAHFAVASPTAVPSHTTHFATVRVSSKKGLGPLTFVPGHITQQTEEWKTSAGHAKPLEALERGRATK